MDKKNFFLKGLVDGLPICFGYIPVSFAFGIFALENGLGPAEAILISMSCVTSAGQLAAVPIIAGGGSLMELAISQLVINLRYALMSISLSQKFDDSVKLRHRLAIAFVNTDEVFAVASGQFGKISKWYMWGLELTPWMGWTLGTVLGVLAGNVLPTAVTSSLGVAIYGMFIAIVVPPARAEKGVAMCVGIAVALSCLFAWTPLLRQIPSGFVIIICAVAASAIMAAVEPLEPEVDEIA